MYYIYIHVYVYVYETIRLACGIWPVFRGAHVSLREGNSLEDSNIFYRGNPYDDCDVKIHAEKPEARNQLIGSLSHYLPGFYISRGAGFLPSIVSTGAILPQGFLVSPSTL